MQSRVISTSVDSDAAKAGLDRTSHISPDALADLLERHIQDKFPDQYSNMSEGEKVYLSSWLLTLSGYITNATEEKRRLSGELPVRAWATAASVVRSYEVEHRLYRALLYGNITPEEAKVASNPDHVVYTVHPSFSGTRGLVNAQHDTIKQFLLLSSESMSSSESVVPAIASYAIIQELLSLALNEMRAKDGTNNFARTKRTRVDEIYEGFVDYIPRVVDSTIEEVAIMLRRARNVGIEVKSLLTIAQLDNLAAATSDHSSWIIDGDGKVTCRAWDHDVALTAARRSLAEKQLSLLELVITDLKRASRDTSAADGIKEGLSDRIRKLTELEKLAQKWMQATSNLQDYKEANHHTQRGQDDSLIALVAAADEANAKYKKARQECRAELRHETSAELRDFASSLKHGDKSAIFSMFESRLVTKKMSVLTNLDALYLSASKGDFPIKLERRENAAQHKEVMREFLKLEKVRDLLVGRLSSGELQEIDAEIYQAATTSNDDALLLILEHLAEIVQSNVIGQVDQLKEHLLGLYKRIALAIAPQLPEKQSSLSRVRATPLEPVESLLIADLAHMSLVQLYPEAYRRTVIAEAATPEHVVLQSFDRARIREEVVKRGKSDLLIAYLFKELMGAGQLQTVMLLEDPYTVLESDRLLSEMLNRPLYYPALGIDLANPPTHTMKILESDGTVRDMTAYELFQRNGMTDEILLSYSLDLAELKEARVYIGPAKMLANSDAAKRGTLAASTINDISMRRCMVKAGQQLLISQNGKYIYINPMYLGQGGSIPRITGVNINAPQYTEQGEHAGFRAGAHSAPDVVARMVGRHVSSKLAQEGQPASEADPSRRKAMLSMMLSGNPGGLMDPGIAHEEELALMAIDWRIRHTRDDTIQRYMKMLDKYGIAGISVYAARPPGRKTVRPGDVMNFVNIRAIGLAAKEMELFTNVIGLAEMFIFDATDKVENIEKLKLFFLNNQTGQHNFASAIFALNMFYANIEDKWWHCGGVTIGMDVRGCVILSKEGQTVRLSELAEKFDKGEESHANFDQQDITLAKFHHQAERLLSGLDQIKLRVAAEDGQSLESVFTVNSTGQLTARPLMLVPESLRPTMLAYTKRLMSIHRVIRDVTAIGEAERTEQQISSLGMARDAYFQLLEAGPVHIGRVPYLVLSK